MTREKGNVTTKERQVTTREGQVATEEGAFLACLTCPYVFCVPFHDLAAPLELAPGWRDSAFPAPCGGVPPPHRPARQRGFSAAKNPEVFITADRSSGGLPDPSFVNLVSRTQIEIDELLRREKLSGESVGNAGIPAA